MGLSERSRVVAVLGVVQIFAWGSTFYLLAVLSARIATDTGWPATAITAGASVALLVSGLAARRVGHWIQAFGGRPVLACGLALIAVGLIVLGLARALPVYFAAWAVIGAGMAGSLYEAAFSTLGRLYGQTARSAITALTLWGGFASTICWPITAVLMEALGWRGACFAYAALHLGVTLPLCWLALPRIPPAAPPPDPAGPARAPVGRVDLRFWCIAVAGVCLAGLFSILSIHLITILLAQGHGMAVAVGLGALIGPSQVGARLLEWLGHGRHHPVVTMIAAATLVLGGFVMLTLDLPPGAALIAYGAGTGLWSIARGALPLAVFAPADYAVMMGRLATPILIASAIAPLIGAALIDGVGPTDTLRFLGALALIPVVSAAILARAIARPPAGP